MTISSPPGYPSTAQTNFARMPRAPLSGDLWEGELFNERPASLLIPFVTPVALGATVTIAANNPGDLVGVDIDGGVVSVTAGASADATAALLAPAILAAAFTDALIADATDATNVVTVAGVLGEAPTITEFSPDATTATVAITQAAAAQQELCWGMGVVRDIVTNGVNTKKCRKPTSLSDMFAGVLIRTQDGALTPDQLLAAGFNPDFLPPGRPQCVMQENAGVVTEFIVGTMPLETDPVYFVMAGSSAGYWGTTDGGTSQADTITIVSVADGNIAFTYDGLVDLVLLATASAATDADALAVLWNANAGYAAIGAATGNGDGTISVAFADTAAHVLVDNSTGTSTAVAAIDTVAIAANAKLMPGLSWGKPSIAASASETARAFLRLSNP